jgi:hypothetical protein
MHQFQTKTNQNHQDNSRVKKRKVKKREEAARESKELETLIKQKSLQTR